MTEKEFRMAIVKSYEYTHKNCTYGRSDTTYPPGAAPNYINDCVGLVFLAAYYLGKFPHNISIDEVVDLCVGMGFVKSTDENDVWRHPGVSCYQDRNNRGTRHVNHVFYSLGGSGLDNISKYDLGSLDRIKAKQPFEHVRCNEWSDRRDFFCHLYPPEDKKPPIFPIKDIPGTLGKTVKDCPMYAGAGKDYEKVRDLKSGDGLVLHPVFVTSAKGNRFRLVSCFDGKQGYVYIKNLKEITTTPRNAIVGGTDGTLNIRQAPSTGYPVVGVLKEGDSVVINSTALDNDGVIWCNIRTLKRKPVDKIIYGWVAMCHLYDSL